METESAAAKTPEDIRAMLEHVEAKYKDGADRMSLEEKKKHCDLLHNILRMVGSMESDLRKSMDDSDRDGVVLQLKNLPSDGKGAVLVPKKEDIELLFTTKHNPTNEVPKIEVLSVHMEWNFPYIRDGPKSPNFATRFAEVFVRFGSPEQSAYVHELGSRSCFNLAMQDAHRSFGLNVKFVLCQDAATRAAYRTVGTLIGRLKGVDDKLRALGAVPGRGGVPELSEKLVQSEEFDAAAAYRHDRGTLHAFLCTRIRVDKRQRQAALEPLVEERFEILLELAYIDQDKFPFTCEREFK